MLSDDERERVSRFALEQSRQRYVVTRTTLRKILGEYLNISPSDVQLAYGQYGKPEVIQDAKTNHLQFNISHAGDLAVIAIARDFRIGIDLEKLRPIPSIEDMIKRFFSSEEIDSFCVMPVEKRSRAFMRGWTRKEAFVKAVGDGLSFPLDRINIAFVEDTVGYFYTLDDTQKINLWSFKDISISLDYVASLVMEGHERNIKYMSSG